MLIDARLRHEAGWSDARILNLSSRGLMARTAQEPPRGAYVEICYGTQRIVARVVWARDGRFGARSQDFIPMDAPGRSEDLPIEAGLKNDRRKAARGLNPQDERERARTLSRRIEFASLTLLGGAAAFLAFDAVGEAMSRPLDLIEAALHART